MPIDFGPRSAAFLWCVSITLEILMRLGIVNVGFFWAWTWATILDKSYKLLDESAETAYLVWAKTVWDSLRGKKPPVNGNGNGGRGGGRERDVELPIYNPRAGPDRHSE